MSKKLYVVELSEDERAELGTVVNSKKAVSPEKRRRAQALLKIDQGELGPGWTDEMAADAFDMHPDTVRDARRRLVEDGFERALNRKRQAIPSVVRKIDGAAEARVIATMQGPPPEGRSRWTLQLLADKAVELGFCDGPVSRETIRQTLKKTR